MAHKTLTEAYLHILHEDQEVCDAEHPEECKEVKLAKTILQAAEDLGHLSDNDKSKIDEIIKSAKELIQMHKVE